MGSHQPCHTAFAHKTHHAGHGDAAEGEGEEKPEKHGLICGVSAGDGHGDGRVTCGIPMYRDKQTRAPYILPLYSQPPPGAAAAANSNAPIGSATASAGAASPSAHAAVTPD